MTKRKTHNRKMRILKTFFELDAIDSIGHQPDTQAHPELGGNVDLVFESDGAYCRIEFPLESCDLLLLGISGPHRSFR